jgi:hypothetical protein
MNRKKMLTRPGTWMATTKNEVEGGVEVMEEIEMFMFGPVLI